MNLRNIYSSARDHHLPNVDLIDGVLRFHVSSNLNMSEVVWRRGVANVKCGG